MKIQNKIKLIKLNPYIKTVLRIIHEFHSIIDNQILFVGDSLMLNENLINRTQHTFIPIKLWENGFITNKQNIFQKITHKKFNIEKFKTSRVFFKLKKKPNLIVVLNNSSPKIHDILKEIYSSRIPLLIVNSKKNQQFFSSYKIPNIYMDHTQNYLFFELLHSILKLKSKIKKIRPNILRKWQKKNTNYKKNKFRPSRIRKNVNKKK